MSITSCKVRPHARWPPPLEHPARTWHRDAPGHGWRRDEFRDAARMGNSERMTPETQTAVSAVPRPAPASSSSSPSAAEVAQPHKRKRMLALLVIAVAAIAGFFVWRTFAAAPTSDALITLSGRIEADEAT